MKKLLFLLPLLFFAFSAFAQDASQKEIYECSQLKDKDLPQYVKEGESTGVQDVRMGIAMFTGNVNMSYSNPKELSAKINSMSEQRKFYISFVIDETGKVTNVESNATNNDVKQFLSTHFSTPNSKGKWTPGKYKGQNVCVRLYFHLGTSGMLMVAPEVK